MLFTLHMNIIDMKYFMTFEKSRSILGVLAFIIIVHHLYERYILNLNIGGTYYKYLIVLYDCSYIFIPILMFISGYGLYISFKHKNKYLDKFVLKRILPIYVQLVIVILTLSILSQFTQTKESLLDIIKDITLLKTFNYNGWYVIAIIIFYFVFYISFKTYKNEKLAIISIIVFTVIYVSIGLVTNHGMYILQGEIWYNAVHLFVLGIIFAYNENNIIKFTNKRYKLILILDIIALIVLIQLVIYAEETWGYYGDFLGVEDVIQRRIKTLIIQQITGVVSVYTVILLSLKFNIENKTLIKIGNIALELYIVHYAILIISSKDYFNIINKVNYIIFALLSVIIAFPLAYGLNKVRVKIYNKFK